jgi:hypothetical protein
MRRSIPIWLMILVFLLLFLGCRTAAPPVDMAGEPLRATLAGRVIGPMGSGRVAGRLVTAVEVTNGARYSTMTHSSGGFTMLVPPGRYRLDVVLTWAERLVSDPGVIDLEPAALVRDAVVVVGGAGLASER